LRVNVLLRHAAAAIRTAKRSKPGSVAGVLLRYRRNGGDCEWNRIAGYATHDRGHVVSASRKAWNRSCNGIDGPRSNGGLCRAEVNHARSLRLGKGRSSARHDGECIASYPGGRADPCDLRFRLRRDGEGDVGGRLQSSGRSPGGGSLNGDRRRAGGS